MPLDEPDEPDEPEPLDELDEPEPLDEPPPKPREPPNEPPVDCASVVAARIASSSTNPVTARFCLTTRGRYHGRNVSVASRERLTDDPRMSAFGDRLAGTFGTLLPAGVASLFVLISTAMFGGSVTLPMPEASVDQAFRNERGIAERAGFHAIEDGRLSATSAQRSVLLAPGECVSIILGVAGSTPPEELRVADARTGATLQGERSTGTEFVRHMQWCSPRGGSYAVDVRSPSSSRLAIFKGVPLPDSLPLPRVDPPAEALPGLRDEVVTAAMEHDAAPWLIPVTRLAAAAPPMLLPSTPATRAALREAMLLDADADLSTVPLTAAPEAIARHDLVDDTPRDVAPEARSQRRHHRDHDAEEAPAAPTTLHPVNAEDATPVLRLLGVRARIIAAVDAGALGSDCVALRFARADAGASTMMRVEVPGWRTAAVASRGGVARDVVCPGDGLRVYARADGDATVAMVFAAESLPMPDAGVAAPSTWRGESSPHSLVARLEAECERDARGCLALADLAGVTGLRAQRPTVDEALRRACERQHGASCGRYGASLLAGASRDVGAAMAALRRGCELGDAMTCAVLATRERLGYDGVTQDIAAAFAHYSRACELGNRLACSERDTMRLLHLPG